MDWQEIKVKKEQFKNINWKHKMKIREGIKMTWNRDYEFTLFRVYFGVIPRVRYFPFLLVQLSLHNVWVLWPLKCLLFPSVTISLSLLCKAMSTFQGGCITRSILRSTWMEYFPTDLGIPSKSCLTQFCLCLCSLEV